MRYLLRYMDLNPRNSEMEESLRLTDTLVKTYYIYLNLHLKNHFTDHSMMWLSVNNLKVQNSSNSQSGCTSQSHR